MSERFWKVLNKDRTACHGGQGKWLMPRRWLSVEGPLVPCQHGLHVCRREDLVHWLGPTIWEVEVEGEQLIAENNKVVVRKARLVRQVRTWNEKNARLFACDCAEAVLPMFEKNNVSTAPRKAIIVAQRFANKKATQKELDAARAAAWNAARDATRAAAYAARAAARAAAYAARAAAWDAAQDAAWAAAQDAAQDAAWAAAWAAQSKILFSYLYPKGLPE